MATVVTAISQVLRTYNMPRNTPIFKNNPFTLPQSKAGDATKNPWENRIPAGPVQDPGFYLGSLGNPVVADITLVGGTYFSDELGRQVTYQDVVLETVLMTVARPKRIIKTDITGRDGTIKEYINLDDWQITINGVITGANGVYPTQEVMALDEICEAPVSIPVVSWYLQNLKIFNLVIENHSFDQEPGGISKQNFTLNCISDRPVELILIR
jgi:hypothetical protein